MSYTGINPKFSTVTTTSDSGTHAAYMGADASGPWVGSSTNHDFRFMTNSTEVGRAVAGGGWNFGVSATTGTRATYQIYAAGNSGSGNVNIYTGAALAQTQALNFQLINGATTLSGLGIYYPSAQATGFLVLGGNTNGAPFYYWSDGSGTLNMSSTPGNIGISGTVVGTQSSDERLKENIQPLELGLETISALKPIRYKMAGRVELGFGAQTTRPIIPEAVHQTDVVLESDPDGEPKLVMDYVRIVPVLVKAVQELSAEVAALKALLRTTE